MLHPQTKPFYGNNSDLELIMDNEMQDVQNQIRKTLNVSQILPKSRQLHNFRCTSNNSNSDLEIINTNPLNRTNNSFSKFITAEKLNSINFKERKNKINNC